MLRWRLILGTLIIAALAALFWLDHRAPIPGLVLLPVLLVMVVLATQELLALTAAADLRPVSWVVFGGNMLIVMASWWPCVFWPGKAASRAGIPAPLTCAVALQDTFLALGLAVLVAFVAEMGRYQKPGRATGNLAAAVLALVYVGLLPSLLVQLRIAWGVGALASLVIVVKLGDIGAYTVGRLLGQHKLAPTISPGKTVEGTIGGLALSVLGSCAVFGWLMPLTSPRASGWGSWGSWVIFGLLLGLAGVIGDLGESLLKRDVGHKDSSRWMPGFGGVLDMVDSLLLAAPVAYACWLIGLVG